MNRKLQRLAAFGLMVVMLVAVAGIAFATETLENHEHKWKKEITTPASCTAPEVSRLICTYPGCNEFAQDPSPAPALGHNMAERIEKAPTCTVAGSKTVYCTRCSDATQTLDIAALGHDWTSPWEITKSASCHEGDAGKGEEKQYCGRRCGEFNVRSIPRLTTHTYNWVNDDSSKPNCTEGGSRTGTCSVCSKVTNETVSAYGGKDQSRGHKFGAWSAVVPGDCENNSYRSRECSLCKRVEKEFYDYGKHVVRTTTKNGKTYEWFLREPASMNGPGRAVQTCKYCGKVIKSREIKFEGGRYNIAVTAFGPRASAINSALFGLNDRLIPVDFTKIEEQVFALVTDDGILVGEMRVSVMDDTVSVSYQMNDSQTIVSQAVFYMFPDAQSITAADLSDPTRAMPFGTTLPLNGQTYGVIAARLVVNYNAENSANRAFPDSGIYLDGATNNATILQEMTTNLME